jgi:hypothetical protein
MSLTCWFAKHIINWIWSESFKKTDFRGFGFSKITDFRGAAVLSLLGRGIRRFFKGF